MEMEKLNGGRRI